MIRLIVLVVLTAVAVGVALALQRRRPEPPSSPSYKAPTQVDRDDFEQTASTLIAVFTSATCASCAVALETARSVVAGAADATDVAMVDLEVNRDSRLHQRYKIDGVPTTLVIDHEGVVQASFFGPTDVAQVNDAIAF